MAGAAETQSDSSPASAEADGIPNDAWREALQPDPDLDALARRSEGVEVTCVGRSMEPALRVGDRVRVWATGTPSPGCVVLFRSANSDLLILHRIIFQLPGTPYFFHIGDAHSDRCQRVGVAKVQQIVGYARELSPQPPSLKLIALTLGELRRGAFRVVRQGRLLNVLLGLR